MFVVVVVVVVGCACRPLPIEICARPVAVCGRLHPRRFEASQPKDCLRHFRLGAGEKLGNAKGADLNVLYLAHLTHAKNVPAQPDPGADAKLARAHRTLQHF